MKRQRFVVISGMALSALALSFWLILFASATAVNAATPAAAPPGPIQAPQAISVTFPLGDWPPYAQAEITVRPEPPLPGRPAELCAVVVNHDPTQPHTVTLEFRVAPFGIGVLFLPVGAVDVVVPPASPAQGCVTWVPPKAGHWCIEVLLHQPGAPGPERSQRNIDIGEPLVPGTPHTLRFQVGPLQEGGRITFTHRNLLPNWDVAIDPPIISLSPSEIGVVSLTTYVPAGAVLGTWQPIVDVEGYLNGELLGGFRKMDIPPVVLHQAKEPFFAESEIHVWPYPPRAGEPTQICVEIYNMSDAPQVAAVQFRWANFGIGLPWQPINGELIDTIPSNSHQTRCIYWVPPMGGHFCVQAELRILGNIPYQPQFSQRNLDVAEVFKPNKPEVVSFLVGNFPQFTNPKPTLADIVLRPNVHLTGWEVVLEPPVLRGMKVEEIRWVTMTLIPPADLPPDGAPIVDVRAIISQTEPVVIGGFRKVFNPPVLLHAYPDPIYAEREITVDPYPPRAGEPAEVCVELRNPTDTPQEVRVQFSWAAFGIGLPWQPIDGLQPVSLPSQSLVKQCIHWVPPIGGHLCLQVELFMPNHAPQRSQRNLDVDEPLRPGVPHSRVFSVGNPYERPMTITLGLIPHLPNWRISLSQDVLPNMQPGEVREVELTVTPPGDLPDDGHPIVDVEAYAEGRLIGGFRKIFRPDVPIHRPKDPVYAESEIFVHPYPPREREPAEVGVEIRNPTEEPRPITVTFSAAPFGIGLPFEPIHDPLVLEIPAGGVIRPIIMWVPPHGGLWCIQVEITLPSGRTFWSRLNLDVGEPLEPLTPHARVFPVGNPYDYPVTITLGLIPHLPKWTLELSQDVLADMQPGERRPVTLTVTPPRELPEDGMPIVDVEAFVNGELLGGFRKIFRPPVPIHRPQDPVYAESEIGVDPYPVIPGQPVKLSVEVFNPTDHDRIVTATFSVAPFGIGLPFSITHIHPNPIRIFVPAHGAARGHVIWDAPNWRGKFCVQVVLEMPNHRKVWSRRNIDVGEPLRPGEPHALVFPVGSWPYTKPVTITLGLIPRLEGWTFKLSPEVLPDMQPGERRPVTLTVTPPRDAELGTGRPIVDVEAFVNGELLGGFCKVDRPPVPIHKPHEKDYAETELTVDPDPPQVGHEARISSVIQNTGDTTTTVTLMFGWAQFGMGIPFTTTGVVPPTRTVELPPTLAATAWVSWTPVYSGAHCVQVRVVDPAGTYEEQISRRNIRVIEPPPCNVTRVYSFTILNDTPLPALVDLGLITFNVPEDWIVTTDPTGTIEIPAFGEAVVMVHVTIPCQMRQTGLTIRQIAAIQQTAGSVPTIDVEGYVDGERVGGIELQFETLAPVEVGVELSPGTTQETPPDAVVRFTHILTNTGDATDTIALEATSDHDWDVMVSATYQGGTFIGPFQMAAGMTATVAMSVTVPSSVVGITDHAVITATSQTSPTVFATATDVITVSAANYLYLPVVLRQY